ncbi:uncharacterized protein B0T15DRAFT_490020 [Chaetomium strumarium]|uniref:Uncharacterized protein n=1 Tax=Chaetomium strumarium TaxID=1170767 RepID=A0AAJ0H447_9PEZI|nr:hypothetical protein B0T15DRAFT_490020 [Chaetomium strumarium]
MLGRDVWIRDVLMRHMATAPSYIQPLLEALIHEGPKATWTADEAFDWMEENIKSRKGPKRKRDSSVGRLEAPRETRSEAPSFSSDLAEWARASIPAVWVPPSPVAGSGSFHGEEGPAGKDHGSPGTDFSQAVPPWQPRPNVAPEPVSGGTTPTERAGAVPSPSLPDTLPWGSVPSSSDDGREATPSRQANSMPSPSLPDTAPWGSVPATPADGAGASSEAED